MNLTKLFATQAALDEHIMQEHPELRGQNKLDWKLLALQVELGECANEWRGFKKWSKNQQPLTSILTTEGATNQNAIEYKCGEDECGCSFDANDERLKDLWGDISDDCPICENGHLYALRLKNPLLEEFVDCLHFILSIGLEDHTYVQFGDKFTGPVRLELTDDFGVIRYHSITTQFLYLFNQIGYLTDCILECEMGTGDEIFEQYKQTWQMFVGLGEMLGFTWEQIEKAYYAKNKVNHERQLTGY